MTSKKRKEIAQKVKSLETKGLDANQKAIELAKLTEKTQQTFNSLGGATKELIEEQNQSARETQQAVSTKHELEIGKIEEVYDELEQTKENFSKATSSNVSDINQLQNLKKTSDSLGIDSYHISQAEQAKKKENEFLSQLEQSIDGTQAQLRQQLYQSKKRRQNAQDSYINKDLGTGQKTESTPLDPKSKKNLNDVKTENSQDENPARQKIYLAGVDIEKLTEQLIEIKNFAESFLKNTVALATMGSSLFMAMSSNPKVIPFIGKTVDYSIYVIDEIIPNVMDAVEVSNRTIGAESFPLPEDSLPKQFKELSDKQSEFHQLSDEAQELAQWIEIEDEKKRKKKKSKKS